MSKTQKRPVEKTHSNKQITPSHNKTPSDENTNANSFKLEKIKEDTNCEVLEDTIKLPQIFIDFTYVILKPDVLDKYREIEDILLRNYFTTIQKRDVLFKKEQLMGVLSNSSGMNFPDKFYKQFSTGSCRILLLSRNEALKTLIQLAGPENPYEAKVFYPNSIRALFGKDEINNCLYLPLNDAMFKQEIVHFFPHRIIFPILNIKKSYNYLNKKIKQTLLDGLFELCVANPSDPIIWFADWLISNNPFKPKVDEQKEQKNVFQKK